MARKLPDELMFLQNRKAIQKTTTASLKDKVCIITGATSGVGYETVKSFAQGGAHIVMVVRSEEKAQKVVEEINRRWGTKIEYVLADLSHLEEVRKAADILLQRYPHIDVLINCAGMHSTKRTYTKEGFETVFCVNHLSSFLLTRLLLPRLKESAPSKIIQINSEGHRFNGLDINDLDWKKRPLSCTGLRSYGASKTAQLLTVWEMDEELHGSGVSIIAMHPGDVKTNIGSNNGPLYRFFNKHVTSHFLKDPVISGEAIYYLAAAPEMQGVSGKFFHLTLEEKPAKHALNRTLGKQVFERSMELTGLK